MEKKTRRGSTKLMRVDSSPPSTPSTTVALANPYPIPHAQIDSIPMQIEFSPGAQTTGLAPDHQDFHQGETTNMPLSQKPYGKVSVTLSHV